MVYHLLTGHQMPTIKEILDGLRPIERSALYYAFERGLTYHVILPDNKFIGVNTEKVGFLIPDPTISRGCWSVGLCKKNGS